MNYYNPYFFNTPSSLSGISNTPRIGLLTRLFGRSGVTFGNILNGTQRALSFANQAIPFVRQVRPMIGNAKTMFKVMNEFKKSEKPTRNSNNTKVNNNNTSNDNYYNNKNYEKEEETKIIQDDGPTFFM